MDGLGGRSGARGWQESQRTSQALIQSLVYHLCLYSVCYSVKLQKCAACRATGPIFGFEIRPLCSWPGEGTTHCTVSRLEDDYNASHLLDGCSYYN